MPYQNENTHSLCYHANIDVATQSNIPGWTLGKWAEYYDTEPTKREKIRNVISLEVSGTELADQILPPRLVRDVDWVEKFWPNTKKGRGHLYPKVQLYCLMGVADAWTVSRFTPHGRLSLASSSVHETSYRIGMSTLRGHLFIIIFFMGRRLVRCILFSRITLG